MFCFISVPLIKGKVPRNRWYGFRVPKTLRSDSVWYPVNAYSGKCLYVSGLIIAAGSLLLIPLGLFLPAETISFAGLVVTMVPVTWALVKSFRYLRKF
jgi:uncharacterized membrane protein